MKGYDHFFLAFQLNRNLSGFIKKYLHFQWQHLNFCINYPFKKKITFHVTFSLTTWCSGSSTVRKLFNWWIQRSSSCRELPNPNSCPPHHLFCLLHSTCFHLPWPWQMLPHLQEIRAKTVILSIIRMFFSFLKSNLHNLCKSSQKQLSRYFRVHPILS